MTEHLGKQPGNGNLYQWCNWKTIIKERFNTGITKIHPKITSKCVSNHVHNIYSSGCINSFKFKLKEIPDNVDEINGDSACTLRLKISSRVIVIFMIIITIDNSQNGNLRYSCWTKTSEFACYWKGQYTKYINPFSIFSLQQVHSMRRHIS